MGQCENGASAEMTINVKDDCLLHVFREKYQFAYSAIAKLLSFCNTAFGGRILSGLLQLFGYL